MKIAYEKGLSVSSAINHRGITADQRIKRSKSSIKKIIKRCDKAKNEYFDIISDLHALLRDCDNLTNAQKLEYCESERNFMKLYLKNALVKTNLLQEN